MEPMRSAVILVGGASSRLGSDKWQLLFDDRPLICWTAEKLLMVADEVVVVARDDCQIEHLERLVPGAEFCRDSVTGYGPVAGLEAGLRCAKGKLAFVAACDLPFLSLPVVENLFSLAEGYQAAVPVWENGMMETLHAVYERKSMASACEGALKRQLRRIIYPLQDLRVNQVPVEILRSIDRDLLTFFNVNTREDLLKARSQWSQTAGESPPSSPAGPQILDRSRM
ncbi:MAG: molybdenum cofactor guanylyltransferase [Methanotrichaceae archaeon]|nr:molybdenum cofactor guanylyltransferase [Methanotrichaceae archaeon]